jgi:hypothetical protein
VTAPRLCRFSLPTLLGVLALATSAPAALEKADRILILKSERKLTLYRDDKCGDGGGDPAVDALLSDTSQAFD